MTSAALVLFMTLPGLALFYGGLVRTKNVLSVMMQCFAITALVSGFVPVRGAIDSTMNGSCGGTNVLGSPSKMG